MFYMLLNVVLVFTPLNYIRCLKVNNTFSHLLECIAEQLHFYVSREDIYNSYCVWNSLVVRYFENHDELYTEGICRKRYAYPLL